MMTSKDRKDIEQLTGTNHLSNYRDASKQWKHPPTLITKPSNTRPLRTANPYNPNPNLPPAKKNPPKASVGNPTSGQTMLAGPSRQDGPPPSKKPRLHDSSKSPYGLRDRVTANGDSRRPRLAPEVINVDDDNEVDLLQEYESTWKRPSSDELNIISQPSMSALVSNYTFDSSDTRAKSKHGAQIAADGPDTEWVDEKYGNGDMDSDPIENYTESDRPFTRGAVGRAVNRFEEISRKSLSSTHLNKAKGVSPKVDLAQMQKPAKKVRNMKGKKPATKVGDTTFSFFNSAKNLDPVASLTTLSRKAPTDRGPLPVKEAYLDIHYYPETPKQKLEVFWTSDHKLTITANESQLFSSFMTPEHCKTIEYSTRNGPVIKLQIVKLTGYELVTIKFDTSDPTWKPRLYDNLVQGLPAGLEKGQVSNGDILWEVATRFVSEGTSGNTAKPIEGSRMQQLDIIQSRKSHSLQPAPQNGKRKASFDHSNTHSGTPSIHITRSKNESPVQQKSQPLMTRYNADQEAGPSNLRRSTRNTAVVKAIPAADQDEVILVYPQGTPGAVNITNGDLGRLEPGEFLNDTLIEFGLKLWLKGLEQTNPELASQIHVFNSFFYKKLNHKDPKQAYESVRKWTSKFDIFQKKYIIVPINEHLHWYLAIIYEPEHVLSPTASEVPLIRKQTRSSTKTSAPDTAPTGETNSSFDDKDDHIVTSSEAEVERNLNDDFQNSCTIDNPDDDPLLRAAAIDDDDDANSSAALSYVSEEGDKLPIRNSRQESSTASCAEASTRGESPCSGSMNEAVVDSVTEVDPPKKLDDSAVVDSASFYQRPRPKNRKGKEKVTVDSDIHIMDEQDRDEPIIILDDFPKTYIFTMDSLGTRHPQAIKKLANYLKLEAMDKKGVQAASSALGKFASVPVQPNFCDCGVYLLHFAQTFMTDPKQYCKSILAQKPKSMTNKDRQDAWHDYKVADMRETLADRVGELSIEWKKGRAVNGEAKKRKEPEGSSDVEMGEPDVEVVERSPMQPAKKPKTYKANRMRGN